MIIEQSMHCNGKGYCVCAVSKPGSENSTLSGFGNFNQRLGRKFQKHWFLLREESPT